MKSMQAKTGKTARRSDLQSNRNGGASGMGAAASDNTRLWAFAKSVMQALAVTGLLTLSWSVQAVPQTKMQTKPQRQMAHDVTLHDVVTTPAKVMGRKVTIEGVVVRVYNNRLFAIRGKGSMKNSRVPVLASKPIPGQHTRSNANPVRVGDTVQVTGVVTRFTLEEMEKTTGVHYLERYYRVYLSKPALTASMVMVQSENDGNAPNMALNSHQGRKTFATSADFLATPDLTSLIGKVIRIDTAHVYSVISDRGFYVGHTADKRLFTVLDKSLDAGKMEKIVVVKKGQTLALEGTVEKMPTEKGALKRWTVDTKEATQLAKQPLYLHIRFIRFK